MTRHTTNPEFEAVVDLFERCRAEYLKAARASIIQLARDGRVVTINDVIKFGPKLPEGVDPRVRGAVFQRDVWDRLGYGPSDRRVSHGRPLQRFRLKRATE
jgi:hypothetical protein